MAATVLATMAIIVSIFSVFYAHWAARSRDLAAWKRNELLKLTGQLLQVSAERQSEIHTVYDGYLYHRRDSGRPIASGSKVWEMELLVEQIRLLSDRVAASALEIYDLHNKAEEAAADADAEGIEGYPLDTASLCEALMVDSDALQRMHRHLVETFRSASGAYPRRPLSRLYKNSRF